MYQQRKPPTVKELSLLERPVRKARRIKVDLSHTEYQLVRWAVTKALGWKVWNTKEGHQTYQRQKGRHTYIPEEFLRKMLPFQKINRFPGSYELGRKNCLTFNLRRIPDSDSFYPKAWLLPKQISQFRQFVAAHPSQNFIAKPEASCQGKGITILQRPHHFVPLEPMVVQCYMDDPLLIEGLKFDLRLYVLLKSVDPLSIFLFQEGLARFATKKYKKLGTAGSNNDPQIHLTNYAINKKSPQFVFNTSKESDDIGHKRSLSSVLRLLREEGHDTTELRSKIEDLIIKTFLSVSPRLCSTYKQNSSHPNMCFQIFGFDIMLAKDFTPYLLEVNHTPSFCCDTPLDREIKRFVVVDALNILNLTTKERKIYFEEKPENRRRITYQSNQLDQQLRGGYTKIYPSQENKLLYNRLLQSCEESWTASSSKPKTTKVESKRKTVGKTISRLNKISRNNSRQASDETHSVRNQPVKSLKSMPHDVTPQVYLSAKVDVSQLEPCREQKASSLLESKSNQDDKLFRIRKQLRLISRGRADAQLQLLVSGCPIRLESFHPLARGKPILFRQEH